MRSRLLPALFSTLLLAGTSSAVIDPASAKEATASAVSSASTTCTIRGTDRADVLVGTSRRDVICGLGGNDVIRGRGGGDLVKSGDGADRLLGGAGADVLVAGPGADEISGGLGADRMFGAAGADLLTAAGGTDTLEGGDGNDDLDGGPQADTIDGGPGTNWCTVGAEDIQDRCVYDLSAPQALEVVTSTQQVDVTSADQEVTVRVHVTDDTGVDAVRISHGPDIEQFPLAPAELESGTVRDGWWTATLVFRRWSPPGTYQFQIRVRDRVSRVTTTDFADPVIEVRDDNPDLEQPRAVLIDPTPDTTLDARTQPTSTVVRARLTDPESGVEDAEACIHEPLVDGRTVALYCSTMRLRSGDIHDGVWRAELGLDEGAVGGDWNVQIYTSDRAHAETWQSMSWVGPDLWDAWGGSANQQPFPDGMGRFTVLGPARTDVTPPSVVSAVPTPSEVDTLAGPATVDLAVRATDEEGGGVTGVGVHLLSAAEDGPQDLYVSLQHTSGTPLDGTWTDPIVLPQGTPPGVYYFKVYVWDGDDNWRTYFSSGHPESAYYEPLPGDPTVTVVSSSP